MRSLFFCYIWRMNFKKCIGTLVVILSLLGISSQQNAIDPNQEIVLQFSNDATKSAKSLDVISAVKQQLLSVGIEQVHIQESQDGQIKITYYSDADVADIKRLFSEDQTVVIDFSGSNKTHEPSEDQKNAYDLKVFEIQNAPDSHLGLAGEWALIQKSDFDRFVNPSDGYATAPETKYPHLLVICEISKFPKYFGCVRTHLSYKIPEVRAGPIA